MIFCLAVFTYIQFTFQLKKKKNGFTTFFLFTFLLFISSFLFSLLSRVYIPPLLFLFFSLSLFLSPLSLSAFSRPISVTLSNFETHSSPPSFHPSHFLPSFVHPPLFVFLSPSRLGCLSIELPLSLPFVSHP